MLLAPVVEARKGEHVQVLEELRAQGFIRARIDGEIFELDQPPKLDLRRKHVIEVVVDRFKVRPDLQQRLAESFETALKLSDGLARVAWMDDSKAEEILFSAKFACPQCGYSITELEPRLFSFNNPAGACPDCDGLGARQFFDPQRVVGHPELSLAGGAVRGWDRRNAYYFQLITSLATHFDFDIETPFEELPDSIRNIILHGSKGEVIRFRYMNERRGMVERSHPFEGIIPNMKRRYHETESNTVREELARYLSHQSCPACGGTRLNQAARHVSVAGRTLPEITALPVGGSRELFNTLQLEGRRGEIAGKILKEIHQRLEFLVNVGLDYLSLERSAETLSGGEAQRIRLASQIGAGLVGVMYVLDEPSIGLHQRDNQRLLATLTHLRDLGNTVIVVEHDEEAIRAGDHVVDIGPGAGVHGGRIVSQGTPAQIMADPQSLTGQYLSGQAAIAIPKHLAAYDPDRVLTIRGATGNNLKSVTVEIPVGLMTCVTGVSGSGKSTLVNDTLYRRAAQVLNRASEASAPCDAIEGLDHFDKVVDIDQSPIGRTPRSNPATYTGLFTPIRELFAATQEARSRGYKPGRFSFNVKGGRCEACQGDGVIKVEMHFLPDIYVPCDVCKGKRYNRETLDVRYKGKTIHEVLELTVEDAVPFFSAIPVVARKLQTLMDVGLSLPDARPERHHPVRRRGAAHQAGARAVQARHRQDAVHPRRADHRPALPRHRPAPAGTAPAARSRQYRHRHRAQPGRHQDRRLDHRHGSGRRQRRRHRGHHRHTTGGCPARRFLYRAIPRTDTGAAPASRPSQPRRKAAPDARRQSRSLPERRPGPQAQFPVRPALVDCNLHQPVGVPVPEWCADGDVGKGARPRQQVVAGTQQHVIRNGRGPHPGNRIAIAVNVQHPEQVVRPVRHQQRLHRYPLPDFAATTRQPRRDRREHITRMKTGRGLPRLRQPPAVDLPDPPRQDREQSLVRPDEPASVDSHHHTRAPAADARVDHAQEHRARCETLCIGGQQVGRTLDIERREVGKQADHRNPRRLLLQHGLHLAGIGPVKTEIGYQHNHRCLR